MKTSMILLALGLRDQNMYVSTDNIHVTYLLYRLSLELLSESISHVPGFEPWPYLGHTVIPGA